jgi:hypothetical protein
MRQIQTQQRRVDEERGALGALCKRARSAGENIKAIKEAIKASKQDPMIAVGEARDEIYYRALRIPLMTQASLFDGLDLSASDGTRQADDLFDARENGIDAGQRGAKPEECQYPPGSDPYAEWHAGWRQGQAALARKLGPDETMADPSRARPRRKQASKLLPYEEPEPRPKRKAAQKERKVRRDKGQKKPRRNGPQIAEDGAVVY